MKNKRISPLSVSSIIIKIVINVINVRTNKISRAVILFYASSSKDGLIFSNPANKSIKSVDSFRSAYSENVLTVFGLKCK